MVRNLKGMSHSGRSTLHSCPRKYELDKLIGKREQTVDTLFGTAVGNGVQELFISRSLPSAILTTFLSWKDTDSLFEEDDNKGKKNVWFAIHAVIQFNSLLDTLFSDYDLAILSGKPACEVGFKIDLGDGYSERGYIDVVLVHKKLRKLLLLELKTTKFKEVNEAMFKNSNQALGYNVVVDSISESLNLPEDDNYFVVYPIYKTGSMEWDVQQFEKSLHAKARWIAGLLEDKEKVVRHLESGYFPMHGESCYDFFRECPFFGMCEMNNKTLLMGVDMTVEEEKDEKFMFHFSLEDIINKQLNDANKE